MAPGDTTVGRRPTSHCLNPLNSPKYKALHRCALLSRVYTFPEATKSGFGSDFLKLDGLL